MDRDLVSKDELRAILNEALSEHDTCDGCRFGGVVALSEEDEDGCNWSSPALRCSGVSVEVCLPAAQAVLASARARYNLDWSPPNSPTAPPD